MKPSCYELTEDVLCQRKLWSTYRVNLKTLKVNALLCAGPNCFKKVYLVEYGIYWVLSINQYIRISLDILFIMFRFVLLDVTYIALYWN